MTPNQIIEACGGIRELTALVLPFKQARALAALKRALQEELDAIIENDMNLAESLGGKKEGSDYVFSDQEAKAEFLAKTAKAHEEDDETLKLPTVDLSGQTSQLRISANAIMALEGIVIFDREETTT